MARVTLERAERALAADRTNGFASSWGAMALVELGEVERVKRWIDRALLIDPDNPDCAGQLRLRPEHSRQ